MTDKKTTACLKNYSTDINDKRRQFKKKALSFTSFWNMLKDFEVCPALCSKFDLLNVFQHFAAEEANQVDKNTTLSALKSKFESTLSFEMFWRLLWFLARDCEVVSGDQSSLSCRMNALLNRMNGYFCNHTFLNYIDIFLKI